VRGPLRAQSFSDYFKYAIHILQHIVVPESQNAVIPLFKQLVSHSITVIIRMLYAIDLDDQPTFTAHEIHNIRTDWFLPDKFTTIYRARTQAIPKTRFGVGRV